MARDDINLVQIFRVSLGGGGGYMIMTLELKEMVGHLCINESLVGICIWLRDQSLWVCFITLMVAPIYELPMRIKLDKMPNILLQKSLCHQVYVAL
jgi:hypothetical protein